MNKAEFVLMMAVGLTCAGCAKVLGQSSLPAHIEKDGHTFSVEFHSEIVTNPEPAQSGIWMTNGSFILCATNYANYFYSPNPPHEDPFPRVSQDTQHFEVMSNSYAFFILDGDTNRVAQASVRLGRIERSVKTTICTVTNTAASDVFTAGP